MEQYTVSKRTAEGMKCLQELNILTLHIANIAEDCEEDEEVIMQPINAAALQLQDAIIKNLIADSIKAAATFQHITEI